METTNDNIPSREEIISSLSEMIEVKKLQTELQELNTRMAVARAEEIRAIQFQAQVLNPQANNDNVQPHTVTQEDLDNNPDLVEAGVEVGEEILVPKKPAAEKKLKKK